MSRKIRSIKFYQAVMLEGVSGSITSFQTDDAVSDAAQRKGLKAEVSAIGVELASKVATTLVPFNNVAYVQFINEAASESKPAKSK